MTHQTSVKIVYRDIIHLHILLCIYQAVSQRVARNCFALWLSHSQRDTFGRWCVGVRALVYWCEFSFIVRIYEILLNMDWFSFLSSIYAIFQCTFECAYKCVYVCMWVCCFLCASDTRCDCKNMEKLLMHNKKDHFKLMSVFVDFSQFIQLISIFPIYFV